MCKKDNFYFFRYVLISPETEILCRPSPILLYIIWWYLVGTYIRSSKCVTCKKDTSYFKLSPMNEFLSQILVHFLTSEWFEIF